MSNIGFLWRMNSPLIAQKVWVKGRRAPKGLNPAKALIGPDANPAHMIYECLVNAEWGMAGTVELIDSASFEAAGVKLFDEGFGLSIFWARQQTIEDFVTEILDHIQATLYVNPTTGLMSLKLLRDDYDVAGLRHITPENAKLSNFRRRSGGEIVNQISLTWTNPDTEKEETVTAQDIASIQSQGGEKIAGTRNYYGIRNVTLATKILSRDLRASTAPLVSADAVLDRSAWDVLPGEVMLLSWPSRGVNSYVVRAGKVNYGRPKDSSIRVPLLQDIFSLERPPIALLPSTDWVDPATLPAPLTMQIFTLPRYFAANAAVQAEFVELLPPEVLVGVLADSDTIDSLDYELMSESVSAGGDVLISSKGNMSLTPLGVLSTALAAAPTSELPAALFPNIDEAPRTGGFVFIGDGDTAQEIALVTGRTATGWTIARGLLDTIPRAWAAGTRVWSVNAGARIVDDRTLHAAGETVEYRGLDRTAKGILPYEAAPTVSATLTERPHLPLRPANVKVNGVGFGTYALVGSSFTLSWSIRNRLLEDSQVLRWTDATVPPEYRQETVIRAYNGVTGAFIQEYAYLWTETSVTFTKANFDRYASVRFEIGSRRDDLRSLNAYSVLVTGFANNGTSPPPDPFPRTEPPSTLPAPGAAAYTVAALTNEDGAGGVSPGFKITGRQDNVDADQLVARYRPSGTTSWTLSSLFSLNLETQSFSQRGLLPLKLYNVQIAYVDDGLLGEWRTLSNITTGDLVATGIGGVSAADVAEAIAQIREAGEGVLANFNTRFDEIEEGLAQAIYRLHDYQPYQRALVEEATWIENESVGTYAKRRTIELFDGQSALVADISLIGARTPDGMGFILNADTVQISDGVVLVDHLAQMQASTETAIANAIDEINLVADLAEASAHSLSLLGVQISGGSAFRLNESTLYVGSRGALGNVLDALAVVVGGDSATVVDLINLVLNEEGGLAERIGVVELDYGDFNTRITTIESALGEGDSGEAVWGVSLDVNGYISGLRQTNTGLSAGFYILANEFAIATPGEDPLLPFQIVGDRIRLTGDVEIDGDLSILNGSLTTDLLEANAVTAGSFKSAPGVLSMSPGLWNSLVTTDPFVTSGAPISLDFGCWLTLYHPAAGGFSSPNLKVIRTVDDGMGGVETTTWSMTAQAHGGDQLIGTLCFSTEDPSPPPAGSTVVYAFAIQYSTTNFDTQTAQARFIRAREFKR